MATLNSLRRWVSPVRNMVVVVSVRRLARA